VCWNNLQGDEKNDKWKKFLSKKGSFFLPRMCLSKRTERPETLTPTEVLNGSCWRLSEENFLLPISKHFPVKTDDDDGKGRRKLLELDAGLSSAFYDAAQKKKLFSSVLTSSSTLLQKSYSM
jgi:hypothetical protein